MTLKTALAELKALGNEKMRKQNVNHGSGDNQFGVRRGDIRKVAKKIKSDHALALELWKTGNVDAQFLATLIIKPAELSADEVDALVRSMTFAEVADWLISYVIKQHPDKEALRKKWMRAKTPMQLRAGWSLTAERVAKAPDGLDLPGLLDRIESEMARAASEAQWTMNICLVEIGVHFPAHRKRALAIAEKLGIYRDYPVPKGCTSPFAPMWIAKMVSQQG